VAHSGDHLLAEAHHSLFTSALVEGLDTGAADRDQDGYVGLDELYDYVYDKVRETTPNQTPGKWTFGVQGDLHIARRSRPVTRPTPLPAELQQAIDSPFAAVRTAAVQEAARLLHGSHAGLALAARLALEQLCNDDSRTVAAAAMVVLGADARPVAAAEPVTGDTPKVKFPAAFVQPAAASATARNEAAPDTPEPDRPPAEAAAPDREMPRASPAGHSRLRPADSTAARVKHRRAAVLVALVLPLVGWMIALGLGTGLVPGLIVVWMIAGLIVGSVAARYVKGGAGYGLIGDLFVCSVGALVGGAAVVDVLPGSTGLLVSIIPAFIGAATMFWIVRKTVGVQSP